MPILNESQSLHILKFHWHLHFLDTTQLKPTAKVIFEIQATDFERIVLQCSTC